VGESPDRIYVDLTRELNTGIAEEQLHLGDTIIVYDTDQTFECKAVLDRDRNGKWIALN
jgi:hypothetical protein